MPMKCPKCLKENSKGSNFCNKCGFDLLTSNINPPEVNLSNTHIEGERKTATILFSDLSGYTAMTENMDPEKVKNLMGDIFEKAGRIVEKYQGTVERFFGDEIMILFGVPKAHEDDPIRAIHTAIEIHKLVDKISPEFEKKYQAQLSMHTGINSGLVITGDKYIGKGRHGLTGDTINLAKRLTGIAKTNEIIVGSDTFQKTSNHFSFEKLDSVQVKGKANLVKIYKVEGRRKRSKTNFNRHIFSEIVGRDKQLNKLALNVRSAIDGKGSVVNIVGEAGIGKSRLFAEFSKLDVVKNITLLEGKAISIGTTMPFYPFVDFLKPWANIEEEDNERISLTKFESLVKSIDKESVNEIVPFVATMMGMKLSIEYKKRMEGITGEPLEKLIFKNLRDLLIKAAHQKTLVIVMEDLHWADESSIELLEVLFNLTKEYNILFVNVFRPGFKNTGDRISKSVQNDTTLNSEKILLKALDSNMSELMVNNMLKIKGLSHDIKHKIIDRAGGNPFFIEEVVRSFIDEGAIVLKDSEFILTDKINEINVPHTIADLLNARIDRLEDNTRELIKIASVIGRNFFDKILKQVAIAVDDIDTRLDYLKDIQLIREKDQIEELEYLFKHALAQEVAYNSLLHERRRELHLNVANSIETIFKERLYEFYGTLSYHYTNAGDPDKAEEYMLKAGEEAMQASASSEALRYYQKALDLYVNKHGKDVDKIKIADLQETIGTAFFNKGLFKDAFDYFNKSKVNRGEKEWKLNASEIFKLMINFIVILRHLYLPSFKEKQPSSQAQEKLFKKNMDIVNSLVTFDITRCLFENMKNMRQTFKFDISKSQGSLIFVAAGIGLFTLTGISSKLGNRFDQYILRKLSKEDNLNSFLYYRMQQAAYGLLVGNWQVKIDDKYIDNTCKEGNLFTSSAFLLWTGYIKIETADFNNFNHIINKLSAIGKEYNYTHAQSDFFVLKSKLSIKMRNTKTAISYIENGIALCRKDGWEIRTIELLGMKARLYMMYNDFNKAYKTFIKTEQMIKKVGKTSIIIPWLSDYYIGWFDFNIQNLVKAVIENYAENFSKFKKAALKSGITAVKHSKKVASERTEAFKLMGLYYWLTNNQKNALKWWTKSIKTGEQLGAKIELSRTYFEVGKNLRTPQSKYKQLNNITAQEYLDKAKTMFEDMDLAWDLNELEKNDKT
jgi:class 3 adenylate cyclase/tetratricopeptide (TPR) repeat protein